MDEAQSGEAQAPRENGGVWSAWPTLGLGLAIGVAALIVQMIIAGIFVAVQIASNPHQDILAMAEKLGSNGLLNSAAGIPSQIATIVMVALVIKWRRGKTVSEYLALRPISIKVWAAALSGVVVFAVVSDGTSYLLGRQVVPQFMIDMYKTSVLPPLLLLLVLVGAPISEEVFFRGFLLEGFRHSRMGNIGAVIATSLMWAALHQQYDAYDIGVIFLLGLLLGAVRLRSRSLWPCVAMHFAISFIATVEMFVHLRGISL